MSRKAKPHRREMQWGHPLARGLIGFWDFEPFQMTDILGKNNHGPSQIGTATTSTTEYGRGAHVAGDTIFRVPPASIVPSFTPLDHHTWEWIGTPEDAGGSNYSAFFAWGGGGTGGGDELLFGVNTNAEEIRIFASGNIALTGDVTFGKPTHAVLTIAGTIWHLYLDGKLVDTLAAEVAVPEFDRNGGQDDFDNRYFLADSRSGHTSVGEAWQGTAVLARVWDRPLSPQEANDLYVDPWGLARPPEDDVAPDTGGSTTTINQVATESLLLTDYPFTVVTDTVIEQVATESLLLTDYPFTVITDTVIEQVATESLLLTDYPFTVQTSGTTTVEMTVESLLLTDYPFSVVTDTVIEQVATESLILTDYPFSVVLSVTTVEMSVESLVLTDYPFSVVTVGQIPILPALTGSGDSILTALTGTGDSVLVALTGTGDSILTTLTGSSLMDSNQDFTLTQGTNVAQPFDVTLDQSRTLDGSESWVWTCREAKGEGKTLLKLTSDKGQITVDGSFDPSVIFTPAKTSVPHFPSADTPLEYKHQLVMLKSGLYEAVSDGVMTMVGSV